MWEPGDPLLFAAAENRPHPCRRGAVAQSPTLYHFEIDLSHVDRGVYQSVSFRVACQPSETPDFLLTRVLAYCLEFQEGISFGKGFTEPGEPALAVSVSDAHLYVIAGAETMSAPVERHMVPAS
jgi:uncharacterized protein YaeQ